MVQRLYPIPTTSIPARGLLRSGKVLSQPLSESQRPQSPPGDYCTLGAVLWLIGARYTIPTTSIPARGLLLEWILLRLVILQ